MHISQVAQPQILEVDLKLQSGQLIALIPLGGLQSGSILWSVKIVMLVCNSCKAKVVICNCVERRSDRFLALSPTYG